MTAILALLRKIPFSAYIITALLIVLVVFYIDIERLHASVASEKASAQQAVSANNTNLLTIKTLQAANDQWKQKCEADSKSSTDKIAELQKEISTAADDEAAMKHQLDTVYETDAKAKSWGDAVVPADVVQRLRPAADSK